MTTTVISPTAAPTVNKAVPTPYLSPPTPIRSALPAPSVARNMSREKPPRVATELEALASIRQCPKFNTCSAPICPLDPNWARRGMNSGQAVCVWFREIAKAGPQAQCVPEELRSQVAAVYPVIVASVGLAPLRAALKRAAKTRSKRDPVWIAYLRSLMVKEAKV